MGCENSKNNRIIFPIDKYHHNETVFDARNNEDSIISTLNTPRKGDNTYSNQSLSEY